MIPPPAVVHSAEQAARDEYHLATARLVAGESHPDLSCPYCHYKIADTGGEAPDWKALFHRLQACYVLDRTALIAIAQETDAAQCRRIALAALEILPDGNLTIKVDTTR